MVPPTRLFTQMILRSGDEEQVVRALAGVDAPGHMAVRRIDHRDIVGAHVGDQHAAVVPQHAGRRLADLRGPQDRQLVQIDRHQAVGALQADEHARGIRRVVEMARHRGGREALQQLHAGGVVDIDLIAREAVHHEEFAVRAEPQLVRIGHRHALLQRRGRRIEEQHLVADGVADQQASAVRAERQVVRLAQHRDAAEFLLRGHVHQADRRAARVDHEGEAGSMRGSRLQAPGQGADCKNVKTGQARHGRDTPAEKRPSLRPARRIGQG